MKELFILIIITIILFTAFVLFVYAAVFKKRRGEIAISIVTFILFLCFSAYTTFKLLNKSYNTITNTFKKRTGEEIYAAIFDEPTTNCLKVLHYQDQAVPVIDMAIWLHFKTCPQELKRILAQEKYTIENVSTQKLMDNGNLPESRDWWKPETMGGAIHVFTYTQPDNRREQKLFVSHDSTEVYYRDLIK